MMKKILATATILLVFLSFTSLLYARGDKHHRKQHDCENLESCDMNHGPEHKLDIEKIKDKLGLSDEQVAQLKTIKDEMFAKAKEGREKIKELREQLHVLVDSKEVDLKQVDAKIDEISKIRTDLHKERIRARIKFHNILTDKQREQLKEHMERKNEHRKHGHKK